jgi:DNA-binding MarR family transcriptional regulator
VVDLKQEIGQQAPFRSVEEQALLNLMRTADCLDRALQRKIRPYGITGTQYNVLRILRGAHPRGLTCSAIGDRMITAEPDVTRLVSRLKKLKLVRQHRDRHDRRVVWTQISDEGLGLLSEMDPLIEKAPPEMLGHLSSSDLGELTRLLEKAREGCGDRLSQPTCDGASHGEHGQGVSCDGNAQSVTCDGRPAQPTCDGQ